MSPHLTAGDLAQPIPTVGPDTPIVDAARVIVEYLLPGVLVVDARGRVAAVLSATELLRGDLRGHVVADCLPAARPQVAVVGPNATTAETAALMSETGCPVVAVVDRTTGMIGTITATDLLGHLLSR